MKFFWLSFISAVFILIFFLQPVMASLSMENVQTLNLPYIKYKDSQFFSYYDSIGFELHHYYIIDLLDSVTIGNVKYIDVYKFNALGTGASIYYSEKNGILKIYENDSTYFEIIGEDNE